MSVHVPSEAEVRAAWAKYDADPSQLDRFLANVRAEAWDEGAESVYYDPEVRGFLDVPDNPHKEAQK